MQENKVVARFKNGAIKKGSTGDFFPNRAIFHLKSGNGEILEINVEELKAVCFVKSFEGDKGRMNKYTVPVPGGGREVSVKFPDGELIIGYTQGYSPTRSGFFLIPADLQNNNERIYVITSATEKVTFL